jgi:hypothetical protein
MFIENNNLNYEANVMLRGTDIDFRTSMKRQRAGLAGVNIFHYSPIKHWGKACYFP